MNYSSIIQVFRQVEIFNILLHPADVSCNAYLKIKLKNGESSYFDLTDPTESHQVSYYEKLNYPMFQEMDWCEIPWEAVSVQFESDVTLTHFVLSALGLCDKTVSVNN